MPAGVSGSLNAGTVLHVGKCWPPLRCVTIFVPIFGVRTDHWSLRWIQKFCNSDNMLARWYMLLGQFSVTFEYRAGSQHVNADGLSRQRCQCLWPDCPVGPRDLGVVETSSTSELAEQPIAESAMGDSMDSDYFQNFLGKRGWPPSTWIRPPVTCLLLHL